MKRQTTKKLTLPPEHRRSPAKVPQYLKLKDSEAFYYALVENIPQNIICKDVEGRFTFVNQKFSDLLNKPVEEIIGKTDFDFFPQDLAQKYREDDLRVMETGEILDLIEENTIEGGETIYVHVVKTPIHDINDNVIGMQGIFWDITERKKAEEALQSANERMKQDLVAASKVQRGFFPDEYPKIEGYQFEWSFTPCEYVGGDLLNVFQLDEDHWAFYVLDVSGHGVPAAMLSVSISRMMEPSAFPQRLSNNGDNAKLKDPESVIKMLNKRFPLSAKTGMFCTMVYAVLNVKTGELSWVRAGHEPPLYVPGKEKDIVYFNEPGGLFVSQMPIKESSLKCGRLTMNPGDRFVLYSDGITEAMKNKEEFGYNRLSEVMKEHRHKPLSDALDAVVNAASRWTDEEKFVDDVTLLALERIR